MQTINVVAAWPSLVSEEPISVTCAPVFGQPHQTRLRRCDSSDVQSTCLSDAAKNLPAMLLRSLGMPELRPWCQCHWFVTGDVHLFQNPTQLKLNRFSKPRTSPRCTSHPMLDRPSYLVVNSIRSHVVGVLPTPGIHHIHGPCQEHYLPTTAQNRRHLREIVQQQHLDRKLPEYPLRTGWSMCSDGRQPSTIRDACAGGWRIANAAARFMKTSLSLFAEHALA